VRAVAATAAVVLVVEEAAAHVDGGVGAALGGAAGGFAVDVAGGGEAKRRLDGRATFGVEAARELAAPIQEPRQVQRPLRDRLVGVVAQDDVGVAGPGLHGRGRLADRQTGQVIHELGFVFSEQAHGAVFEVGDDGLDLAT
jgi:hypothetical protein